MNLRPDAAGGQRHIEIDHSRAGGFMANTTTPGFGGAWSPLSRIRRQSFIPAERQVIYIVYPIMIAAFTWA